MLIERSDCYKLRITLGSRWRGNPEADRPRYVYNPFSSQRAPVLTRIFPNRRFVGLGLWLLNESWSSSCSRPRCRLRPWSGLPSYRRSAVATSS